MRTFGKPNPSAGQAKPAEPEQQPVDTVPEETAEPAEEQPAEASETPAAVPGCDLSLDQVFELVQPIADAEVEIRSLNKTTVDLQTELDEALASLATLTAAKERMLKSLPGCLLKLCGFDIENTDAEPPAVAETPSEGEPPFDADEPVDWQQVATDSICDGVPGLGKKKRAKLVEEYPTLGELNELRIAARNTNTHFADALPKGFGKQTADELADRLMRKETEHGQPSAAEQAKRTAAELEAESSQGDGSPNAAKKRPDSKSEAEPAAERRSKHERWCETLAKSLRLSVSESTVDEVLSSQEDVDTFEDGRVAFDEGQALTTCPEELTQDFAADWIRGWLYEEFMNAEVRPAAEPDASQAEADDEDEEPDAAGEDIQADGQAAGHEDAAEAEPEKPINGASSDSMEQATPDVVERLAKEISESDDRKVKSAVAQWDAGYSAGLAGEPISECKDYFVYQAKDWLRGYYSARDLDI